MSKSEEKELKAFEDKIERVNREVNKPAKKKFDINFSSGWGLGVRLATELLGGVVVGAGIGLVFDELLSTKPWFLVIFLILGSIAGFLNVYRTANSMQSKERAYVKMSDGKQE